MKTHAWDRPFPCPKCDQGFGSKKNLDEHLSVHEANNLEYGEIHLNPERIILPKTEYTEEIPNNGPKQVVIKLTSVADMRFKCHVCERSFKTNQHLNRVRTILSEFVIYEIGEFCIVIIMCFN